MYTCTFRVEECSHTLIWNHKHTNTLRWVKHSISRSSFFPYLISHSRSRQRVARLCMCLYVCVCVLETVWGSVKQAYLAQHQYWDDLLTVSIVRVQRECLCAPGKGQAGSCLNSHQHPEAKSSNYQLKFRGISLDCVHSDINPWLISEYLCQI